MVHEQAHCCDKAANHQFPIAAAFWIIWIVSAEECSRLIQNLVQICCCACSVILNVMATQYTCSLSGVCHPHCTVKSSLFMHVHSSPVSLAARLHWCQANHSCYINNGWTFLDRLYVYIYIILYNHGSEELFYFFNRSVIQWGFSKKKLRTSFCVDKACLWEQTQRGGSPGAEE